MVFSPQVWIGVFLGDEQIVQCYEVGFDRFLSARMICVTSIIRN